MAVIRFCHYRDEGILAPSDKPRFIAPIRMTRSKFRAKWGKTPWTCTHLPSA